jgi:hypothetical protein
MSYDQTTADLIKENKALQGRLKHTEQLLADAQKALEWWNNGQMQQRLVLSQLENKDLREVLICISVAQPEIIPKPMPNMEVNPEYLLMNRYNFQNMAQQALSTPPTLDALNAWRDAEIEKVLGDKLLITIPTPKTFCHVNNADKSKCQFHNLQCAYPSCCEDTRKAE